MTLFSLLQKRLVCTSHTCLRLKGRERYIFITFSDLPQNIQTVIKFDAIYFIIKQKLIGMEPDFFFYYGWTVRKIVLEAEGFLIL